MDPVTTGLALGGTAFGAFTSHSAASAQNAAIERSMQSQQRAATVQTAQLENQAEIERLKIANRAAQVRGRLRVAAADAGVGFGGSYAALSRQATYDEALNDAIVGRNLASQRELVATGLQANLESLAANAQNELLSTLTGGLGGFNTGLSLGQGINSVYDLTQTKALPPFQPVTPPSLTTRVTP